mgnify:CR=1 FL=1
MKPRPALPLPDHWWVSVSTQDAIHAATHPRWQAADLELGDDPENHPRQINLPGGWDIGLRPRTTAAAAPDAKTQADPNFVGGGGAAAPAAKRLPAHFLTGQILHFDVTIRNSGPVYAGKEVVQLYCEAPQGRLGKPARVLAGFAKTRTLKPGEHRSEEHTSELQSPDPSRMPSSA